MNKQLEKELITTYKQFFTNYKKVRQSNIYFGFECDDGWYKIISNFLDRLTLVDCPKDFEIVQIKEKFGGLRIYCHNSNEVIQDIIRETEDKATKTCEICGKQGVLRQNIPWIRTLCKTHYQEKIDKYRGKI